MIIEIDKQQYNLEQLSITELTDLRLVAETKMLQINLQLKEAARKYHTTGERADSSWFKSANYAKDMSGLAVRQIMAEQTRRKQDKKVTFERAFVDVARDLLAAETFQMLMDAANEKVFIEGM